MRDVEEQRPSVGGRDAEGRVLLASITALMALAGALFMAPLLFLAPVPLAVLVYRDGYRSGTVAAVLTLLLVSLAQRRVLSALPTAISDAAIQAYSFATMVALVTIGLIGMVIGGAWREGASWPQAFWLGAGGGVLPVALAWAGLRLLYDVDFFAVTFDRSMEMVRFVVAEAARGGLPPEAVAALEQAVADTEDGFALSRPFLPGFIAVSALAASFVNTGLAGLLLARLGETPPSFPPFARWRFPWPFALLFVVAQAVQLLDGDGGGAAIIAQNVLMVLNVLFALQGAAVGWHFLSARGVVAPLLMVLLVVIYWWAPFVLVGMGVLDAWLDFRRLAGRGAGEGGGRAN